jgi:hypothetical protein
MKKLLVVTAFALAGFTVSAAACDWNREASNEPTVVAGCTGDGCKTADPAATKQDSSKPSQPTQDRAKEEPWPVFTVAGCNGNGC